MPNVSSILNGKRVYASHYFRWRSMMYRCYNQNSVEFKRYGGRGIKVCKEWKNFWIFREWCIATFEDGKSIDRINNNKGYSPSNCRWATPLEQQLNSRVTPARVAAIKYAASCRRPHTKYRERNSKGQYVGYSR